MNLKYKIDVLSALKNKGFSSYRLIKENIFSSGSVQKIRKGEVLGADGIATLCKILDCQPGEILEYSKENEQVE